MRGSWLFVAALAISLSPAQTLTLDDQFDNGNLDGWTFDGTYYRINTNNPPGAWQWVHFRITGAMGQTPRFRTAITNSNDVYRTYHRMVWRYGSEDAWRLMDHGDKPGDGSYYFWNTATFTADEVYVAYWLPYTYGQMLDFAQRVGMPDTPSELVTADIAGWSQQGRPLPYLGITDPSTAPAGKRQCVLVARQHGYESLGNHALEGIVDFLLSRDPLAAKLRELTVFHVYPMANPDAVANGWTREGRARDGTTPVDFNRDWYPRSVGHGGPASASFEIDFLREDIMNRTGGSADLVVDLHSHAKGSTGLGWYWWFHDDAAAAQAFVTSVWDVDRALHAGQTVYTWPQPMAGADSTTLGAWGSGPASGNAIATLGADSFTLEPIAAPFGAVRSAERVRAAGAAIVRAIGRR